MLNVYMLNPRVHLQEDSGIESGIRQLVHFTCIGISSLVPCLPTRLLIPMHVKHTIPLVHTVYTTVFLKFNPRV
jgi:hypothetical protein